MRKHKNENIDMVVVGGKPRRRVRSLVTRVQIASVLVIVLFALGIGAGWWAVNSGQLERSVAKAKGYLIAASAQLGFQVQEILVVGRQETPQAELLRVIRLSRGAPILAFDLHSARERVEALPWIRSARIERMLPNTVLLNVEERQPLALWQHKGTFSLIDHEGEIILRKGLERFADLVVIIGEGAPSQASRLLETLGNEPELLPLVKAAIWVGGRRWNIRLTGNIDVRLPEKDARGAWTRLAEYERVHRVLERDVQVLDLRLPDRLIVRKVPQSSKPKNRGERQT